MAPMNGPIGTWRRASGDEPKHIHMDIICHEKGDGTMEQRENVIRLWFQMWLQKQDLGIADIFSPDAEYIESWGPAYQGVDKIKLWFDEWNTRGTVQRWDIQQFFHRDDQTVVEWYFKNKMDNGAVEAFDGMTLIRWDSAGKIVFLKEFGCNVNCYDPYEQGSTPQFRDTQAMWF